MALGDSLPQINLGVQGSESNELTLSKLKRKRGNLRGVVTKQITKLESDILIPDIAVEDLEESFQLLTERGEELKLIDSQIESLIEIDGIEAEFDIVEQYREKIMRVRQGNCLQEKSRICRVDSLRISDGLEWGEACSANQDLLSLNEWVSEKIIEPVEPEELAREKGHFLPHRPIFKENSTTRIRPVFDASTKERNSGSPNDCIEKGPNYLELIPKLLNRFQQIKYGVISDI
ncbi:integrase_H2C2 domain-containing protein [Trichonephila clavipes]|uniref:Integrase_H2C2 domain-containing protein n=1 Tax=Trichonephila clavipes TaxID=2585209 RepID=A0A8X6SB96_TRICX|nr:integrase_H2C2 domain-containing protein [Trichonephila clavipes]